MTQTSRIERRSIDVVPVSERHGSPVNQLTLWFGANMQITAVVDGALAVVFGADALWAIIGTLVGNLLGGVVMALHSAQGPRLGLPQMISSRAQFGVIGAVVPLVLVVLMYLGFASTGTVLAGQAVSRALGLDTPTVGIVVFGVLSAVVAIVGYRWIHALGRVGTVVGIIAWSYLAVRLFTAYDIPALLGRKPFELATFLLAVSLGAGWQLTYGPYVADYSRYLPIGTPERRTFWATLAGSVIGSQWSMTLGALIASLPAATGKGFLANQVGAVGELAGGGAIAIVFYLVIVVGKLTVNCLNAYGGSMTMLTTMSAFRRAARVSTLARALYISGFIAVSVLVALLASADFLANFKNFVLLLLMVFTPWSAINLVDYYLVSRERVDIPALYDPAGRYGSVNAMALGVYLFGIVVQVPFLAQTLYTGPATEALGGADISWIVGLLVTAAIYYPLARAQRRAPERTVYPEGVLDA
ncbi:purine-cytosine permease family protein [Arsenicicoccus sp. oral taxon 190]|uniref:purine-cytosine permease family protein n=1 Tax=Arsenicicoccus sp. oral taxon 190 TaxID=1658671 RepID=UPI000679F796|nr:cytosine permease [Arsenicicoccus sp. oral taxon 190]AKT51103.1 sulfonate ABC transporter substrate-binding protein [Arsenicicoccus sp. oral taxon 190]